MNHRIGPFSPIRLGSQQLRNHVVMAPMTRSRAYGRGASPTEATARYYAARAGAGLIVTEGIQPSPIGQGYPDTPGLHSRTQVEAWRRVTHAIGPQRTALRISPANPAGDLIENDHRATYQLLVKALNRIGLSYLHLLETTDPDLPRRLAMGAPLAQPDMSRAYGGDETGYTDYPPYPDEADTQAS